MEKDLTSCATVAKWHFCFWTTMLACYLLHKTNHGNSVGCNATYIYKLTSCKTWCISIWWNFARNNKEITMIHTMQADQVGWGWVRKGLRNSSPLVSQRNQNLASTEKLVYPYAVLAAHLKSINVFASWQTCWLALFCMNNPCKFWVLQCNTNLLTSCKSWCTSIQYFATNN